MSKPLLFIELYFFNLHKKMCEFCTSRVKFSTIYRAFPVKAEKSDSREQSVLCNGIHEYVRKETRSIRTSLVGVEWTFILFFFASVDFPFDEVYSPMTRKGTFMALFALSIRVGGSFSRLYFFCFPRSRALSSKFTLSRFPILSIFSSSLSIFLLIHQHSFIVGTFCFFKTSTFYCPDLRWQEKLNFTARIHAMQCKSYFTRAKT